MPTAKDLKGLTRFMERPEWAERFRIILDDHFGPVLDPTDMVFDDLRNLLGDPMTMTLWGCAFEDFLTQDFEIGGNVVDEYLRRRGFKESARIKAYMQAIRTSVMSLYEVVDVVPGTSVTVRDLMRGGEPIVVHEGTASRDLRQWDRLAARVVRLMDRNNFTGGLLSYSARASEIVLTEMGVTPGKPLSQRKLTGLTEDLRAAGALFTAIWLADYLETVAAGPPSLRNMDGDELLFHRISFPIAKGVRQKDIAERLDRIETLDPASAKFWNWLAASVDDDTTGDGIRVLGNVELSGRALLLSVNSAARAERGASLLTAALGDLVGAPTTTTETAEEMRTKQSSRPAAPSTSEPPPVAETRLVHDHLDGIYRRTLDEPVGMLGDLTPRQAVKTTAGRRKAAEWLKHLENQTAHRPPDDPLATYSFLWLWEELGIADLRQ